MPGECLYLPDGFIIIDIDMLGGGLHGIKQPILNSAEYKKAILPVIEDTKAAFSSLSNKHLFQQYLTKWGAVTKNDAGAENAQTTTAEKCGHVEEDVDAEEAGNAS